jgi:porphobilinogen synthase
MQFPITRPRRLRGSEVLRTLVRETELSVKDFIYPVFVTTGKGVRREIASMPGIYQLSVDLAVEEVQQAQSLGIPGTILFGIPDEKDATGTSAFDEEGIIQTAVRAIKKQVKDFLVITDLCLCEYTDHGHCGLLEGEEIVNDPTLEVLAKVALSQAKAGADIIAPSDMMDGRVQTIRRALDAHGFERMPILSYAVKYASSYYGPFRLAAESTPQFGDRKSHQMDPANAREALKEAALDIEEGADILLVKPALPYLDIIHLVKTHFQFPVAAYQVSGEYAAIMAAGRLGWLDADRVMMESLTSIKRAGADFILTYYAKEAAKKLSR